MPESGRGGIGSDAGGGSGGAVSALDPGTKAIHRLNATEYNATVADVLGTSLQLANGSWRGGELAGFDNIASVLGVDEAQYQRYFDAAQALATEVMASDRLRARFVSCDLTDPACVTSSITGAGLRLVRRPLDPEELQTYQRVYESARAWVRRARRVHAGAAGAAFERGLSLPHRARSRSRIERRSSPPSIRAGLAAVVLSLEQRAR